MKNGVQIEIVRSFVYRLGWKKKISTNKQYQFSGSLFNNSSNTGLVYLKPRLLLSPDVRITNITIKTTCRHRQEDGHLFLTAVTPLVIGVHAIL